MTIEQFIDKHPYVYHLTDRTNYDIIIAQGKFLSTKSIVELSTMQNPNDFLRTRRVSHSIVKIGDTDYKIRDQRPISEVVLGRCLTDNWTTGDFIEHLNKRVFFWPNLSRLKIHYGRYQNENPLIFRIKSSDILNLYPDAEFCRLNSGATRCNSYLGGNAPARGPRTFLPVDKFEFTASKVAEVTIPDLCNLPSNFWISDSPDGPWVEKNI